MPQPAHSPTAQARFLSLLKRDILKIELAELDFGIYRILNYRRTQVLEYLDVSLPQRIAAWVQALSEASAKELAETESANCYYHLHTFFGRYWDDGDFIPRARRGGSAAYSVPYNGQDTHFHWATKGSHYVKSGELFARYAYKDGTQEVRFVLKQAEIAKDNAKGAQKYFFPSGVESTQGGFELNWQWRSATDAESKRYKNGANARKAGAEPELDGAEDDAPGSNPEGNSLQERVLNAWLAAEDFKGAKPPKGLSPILLASNARRFVRKNTSDFFVHPQLGEFLRGELDVYLKHEFVQVWDAPDSELPRIRAKFKLVRDIALDLITFLDQIERFQATLFEKRKFVLQADYLVQCSWLLRDGGSMAKALVEEACANAAQAAEWALWLNDKAKKANGKKLLTAFPHLPLHTKHFSADFKARTLACFEDMEAALGGELIHADNYAALRTIEPAYRERVKCIYIDPPYNTGSDGFPYKDGFPTSSWLAMIGPRCVASFPLMSSDGAFYMSVDDAEIHRGRALLDEISFIRRLATFVRRRRMASGLKDDPISPDHEYVLAYGKIEAKTRLKGFGLNPDDYTLQDNQGFYRSTDLSVGMGRDLRPKQFYSITNPGTGKAFHASASRVWRFDPTSMSREIAAGNIIWPDDEPARKMERPRYKTRLPSAESSAWRPASTWLQKESERTGTLRLGYRAGLNQEATRELADMFPAAPQIYPKPASLVEDLVYISATEQGAILDFFAGSGTTGHAVINLNREDGGARKFLLVEQGEYFDTVTLPRIAKVMTAPEWKDGAPKDGIQHEDGGDPEHWSRRTLPLVRVLRLERYEDSLNALDFEHSAAQADASATQASLELVAKDAQAHLLRYWLMDESEGSAVRLSTEALNNPFAYQLTLHEPAGERVVDVDMLETARLLLGLVPKRQRELKDKAGLRHQLMEAVLAADLARGVANPVPVLLWLRPVADARTDAVAKAEHAWLAQAVQTEFKRTLQDYATIFHNRAAFWPNGGTGGRGTSIDALLAARMMERAL